jgi:DNA polymerase III delta prime subunit
MQSQGLNAIGNGKTFELLDRVARSSSLGHAYLLLGPDGVGKKRAALDFARAVNCDCSGGERCESCRSTYALNHPELLLVADANKPRWFEREYVRMSLGLEGEGWRERYAETVAALAEGEYLEPPLPDIERDSAVDGFSTVTDHLFGKGSVPSRECYTPGRIAESIRKTYDQGKMPEPEYRLLRLLYEYPLSVMPYRGAIPIAYITQRQGWQFVRPVQSFLARRSLMGGRKVVIIDDAHKMTPQAQNCLLKTLEEPPDDSVIILVTSDAESLFPTIVSRCQVVRFKRLTAEEMTRAMTSLIGEAGDRAGMIAALSGNCPGRALELSLSRVEERLDAVRDLVDSLVEGRPERVFAFSRSVLGQGTSHRRKARASVRTTLELLIFWFMEIARFKAGVPGSPLPKEYTDAMEKHARSLDEASLLAMSGEIEDAFSILPYNIDLSLLLDATLLKLATAP